MQKLVAALLSQAGCHFACRHSGTAQDRAQQRMLDHASEPASAVTTGANVKKQAQKKAAQVDSPLQASQQRVVFTSRR